MNEKFYSLKKEKQEIMINGAMQIFALNGYRHASTDDMVKASGVSKGLWFHYFDTKAGLYSFVASYGLKYAMLEYRMCNIERGEDYFDVRLKLENLKMRVSEKYPYLPLFIISVLKEEDPDALPEISELKDLYREQVDELLARADYRVIRQYDDHLCLMDMLDAVSDELLEQAYRDGTFTKEIHMKNYKRYSDALRAALMKGAVLQTL